MDAVPNTAAEHAAAHGVHAVTPHLVCDGAAAAIEALFAIAAIERGQLPPSLGCAPRDPEIHLEICGEPRAHACRYVVSNALAFGGSNASVIFGAAS